MVRMMSAAAAVVFSLGAAWGAELPEAPAVGEAAAVQPIAEVDPQQLDRFLQGFTVTAVRVGVGAAAGAAGGLADPAVRGILDMVMGHRGAAGAGAAAGAAAAGAAAGAAQAGRDAAIRPDMPNLFPAGAGMERQQHLIFYDTHDDHFRANWKRQTELLQGQLRRQGVPAGNIRIMALDDKDQFFKQLEAVKGDKQVYFFGHGSPLTMWIGDQSVNVADNAQTLQGSQVRLLAHYGCSFVDVNGDGLKKLKEKLAQGTQITLVGHRDGSTPRDDRWWDPDNPLTRVTVSPTGASMHTARTQLTNRVLPTAGLLLGAPLLGPIPAAVGAVTTWNADIGERPRTLEDERRAREAAAKKKKAVPAPTGR